MKIFISQSGSLSKEVAIFLREELTNIIPDLATPFVSDKDIQKGKLWRDELNKELIGTEVGIICLTKQNINSPWIHYEAGAISKSVNQLESSVWTLLIGLSPNEVVGPLSDFQHTKFIKEDFFMLIESIYAKHKKTETAISKDKVKSLFERSWDPIQQKITLALEKNEKQEPTIDYAENRQHVFEELLLLTRSIASSLIQQPTTKKNRDTLKQKIDDGYIDIVVNKAALKGIVIKNIVISSDQKSLEIFVKKLDYLFDITTELQNISAEIGFKAIISESQ